MIPIQQAMAFSENVDIVNREALERIAKTLAAEVRRLREENERLRGIERAAQWYVDNPNSQRIAISQIKAAIDAARGAK